MVSWRVSVPAQRGLSFSPFGSLAANWRLLLVRFNDQVAHDVFTTLRRVLAHVELEKRLDGVCIIDADGR